MIYLFDGAGIASTMLPKRGERPLANSGKACASDAGGVPPLGFGGLILLCEGPCSVLITRDPALPHPPFPQSFRPERGKRRSCRMGSGFSAAAPLRAGVLSGRVGICEPRWPERAGVGTRDRRSELRRYCSANIPGWRILRADLGRAISAQALACCDCARAATALMS